MSHSLPIAAWRFSRSAAMLDAGRLFCSVDATRDCHRLDSARKDDNSASNWDRLWIGFAVFLVIAILLAPLG